MTTVIDGEGCCRCDDGGCVSADVSTDSAGAVTVDVEIARRPAMHMMAIAVVQIVDTGDK